MLTSLNCNSNIMIYRTLLHYFLEPLFNSFNSCLSYFSIIARRHQDQGNFLSFFGGLLSVSEAESMTTMAKRMGAKRHGTGTVAQSLNITRKPKGEWQTRTHPQWHTSSKKATSSPRPHFLLKLSNLETKTQILESMKGILHKPQLVNKIQLSVARNALPLPPAATISHVDYTVLICV